MRESFIGKNITFIESQLDEDELLLAEAIFEAGAVRGSQKPGNATWDITTVHNSFHHHSQVKVVNDVIKMLSCNCITFEKKGICGHLGASLFYIRQQEEKPVEIKKVRKTGLKDHSLRKLPTFLRELEYNDLVDFLHRFAQKDKLFRWMLQARFIELLTADERNTFIESLVPPITKANQKITAVQVSSFVRVCRELLKQVRNFIEEKNYIDAYHLVHDLVKKSFYLKHHVPGKTKKLIDNHVSLLNYFMEIIQLVEAPEFKIDIYQQLMKLLDSSYIAAELKEEKRLWMLLAERPEYHKDLLPLLQKQLGHPVREYESFHFLNTLQLMTAAPEKREAYIAQKDLQASYNIIQVLLNTPSLPFRDEMLCEFLQTHLLNQALARRVIQELDLSQPPDKLTYRIVDYFISYKDRSFLKWVRKYPDLWQRHRAYIRQKVHSVDHPLIWLTFLMVDDQVDEVLEELGHLADLELSQKFDKEILKKNPSGLIALYKKLLGAYLDDHFGLHAQKYVRRVIHRLREISGETFVEEVEKFIEEHYGSRKNLKKAFETY